MYRCTREQNKLVGESIWPSFIWFKWVLTFIEEPLMKKLHSSLMWSRNMLPLCACIARQSNFTGRVLVRCCKEGACPKQLLGTACIPRAPLGVAFAPGKWDVWESTLFAPMYCLPTCLLFLSFLNLATFSQILWVKVSKIPKLPYGFWNQAAV